MLFGEVADNGTVNCNTKYQIMMIYYPTTIAYKKWNSVKQQNFSTFHLEPQIFSRSRDFYYNRGLPFYGRSLCRNLFRVWNSFGHRKAVSIQFDVQIALRMDVRVYRMKIRVRSTHLKTCLCRDVFSLLVKIGRYMYKIDAQFFKEVLHVRYKIPQKESCPIIVILISFFFQSRCFLTNERKKV